jgi:hypothetical protein
MNIHITENIEKIIDGYQMMPIVYGKIDLGMVPNNSSQKIVAIDALDSIPMNLIEDFFREVRLKMRVGCNAVFGGTELSILSKDVINGKITTAQFNEVVYSKKSIYCLQDIKTLIQNMGLVIDYITIKGYNYEISTYRPQV